MFFRIKRDISTHCPCTPSITQTDMLELLGNLKGKFNHKKIEAAGLRALPNQALSPFRVTGHSEQWEEMMKHVG